MRSQLVETESSEPKRHEHKTGEGAGILRRYVFALGFVLVAFGIRYSLNPILGEELPFMLFIAATLLAAWFGGALAGGLALLLGVLLTNYFFIWAKDGGVTMPRSLMILHFVRYIFTGGLGIILIEGLHRSHRRLLQAKETLRFHALELEKRVEERTARLAASVRSLQDLLYHMVHNLRAPLRAIQGFSEILRQETGGRLDPSAREHLAHISEAALRMDSLIADLLKYGRLTHVEISTVRVNLDEMLHLALDRLNGRIQSRECDVRVRGSLAVVRANRDLLQDVLVNLLENALKFTTEGTSPRVEVWTERRGETIRLCIKDNGIGIDPQYRTRIFEPFERLPSARAVPGNGIGLAIVKEAVSRMGGRVGVESQAGAGSTFWIELPGVEPCDTAEGEFEAAGGTDGVQSEYSER